MDTYVEIEYRKKANVQIEKLQRIEFYNVLGEKEIVTEFLGFRKSNNIEYAFIGEKQSLSINGNDIVYIRFY